MCNMLQNEQSMHYTDVLQGKDGQVIILSTILIDNKLSAACDNGVQPSAYGSQNGGRHSLCSYSLQTLPKENR